MIIFYEKIFEKLRNILGSVTRKYREYIRFKNTLFNRISFHGSKCHFSRSIHICPAVDLRRDLLLDSDDTNAMRDIRSPGQDIVSTEYNISPLEEILVDIFILLFSSAEIF